MILRKPEVAKQLKSFGFEKTGSSEVSDVRKKLGITAPTRMKPLTLDDVDSVSDIPAILGVTTMETIEICEVLQNRSMEIGGLNRLTEALRALNKFTSVK